MINLLRNINIPDEKIVFPKRRRRMGKRMTLLLIEELLRAPKVPVDRLNREAREFEDNVLSKIKKD